MSATFDLSASHYLKRIETLYDVVISASRQPLSAYIDAVSSLALDVDEAVFHAELRRLKHMFDMSWAQARFGPAPDVHELGVLRSRFADGCIDIALQFAWRATLKENRINYSDLKGLFILGLGKLGGYDLNFSSDVDLICFYDHALFPVPDSVGKNYIAHKTMQRLNRILQPKNPDDLIWRLDWRLRPEASASGLAVTSESALNFYFFRSQPWHRLAMIKARPIAGDIQAAADFLTELTPFMWRQNLDYTAFDEIGYLKRRINLEHPTLRLERKQTAPITPELYGFNVKLGRGGIREIEFIVNALQLIWGGKKYELRDVTTLQALGKLRDLKLLTASEAQTLSSAYIFYRRLEDAVQLVDNQQTHIVPPREDRANILSIIGISEAELSAQAYDKRVKVNEIFERYFHLNEPADKPATGENKDIDIEAISARGREIIESWRNGFDSYGVQRGQFVQFKALGQQCLNYVTQHTDDIEKTLLAIDGFFSRLSRSHQYFSLLARNDIIFAALIDPLLYSPHMTNLLAQSPHIIDIFLDPQSPVNLDAAALPLYKPDPSYVLAGESYETQLERLRRFVNENLFAYYHLFLSNGHAPHVFKQLTGLADTTLETTITMVSNYMGYKSPPMAVLALGNMGSGYMSPESDLDLVFVFDDDVDFEIAAKFVRRIKTALTLPLSEGIAYELDMRLRPSGRSGPAAVSFESFKSYHNQRAKTWEHIALCSARCVAGDVGLQKRVNQTVQDVLLRPRNAAQCVEDAALMWSRIKEQRVEMSPSDVIPDKMSEGGLMQAEYLQSTLKLLGRTDADLTPAIDFWRILQVWQRLLNLKGAAIDKITPQYQAMILSSLGVESVSGLARQAAEHKALIVDKTDALFGAVQINKTDKEAPIKWAEDA